MRPGLYLLLGLFTAGLTPLFAETLAEQNAKVVALLPQLQEQVNTFRQGFNTPGMAIAVVTRDNVYPLTSGYCTEGKSRPIRTSTRFQFASVSKPITATFVAMLVSQGLLSWDDRIVDLLPDFEFADASANELTTLRDMLSHRSGLPGSSGDFLEGLGLPQETILHQMRYVHSAENFRQKWQYTNFGITIGGVAAATVTGQDFPQAIRRLFMRPIGMKSATAIYRQFVTVPNRTALHVIVDGVPVPAFVRPAQSQAPGGGMSGTILDLAAFVQLHLNRGMVKGRQIVSPEALDECYTRYTHFAPGERLGPGPLDDNYYGMCWDITVKPDGTEYINHNGAFSAGARTIVSFRRADGIGLVVLTNSFITLLPEAMVDVFFQLYDTGTVRPDTLAEFQTRTAEQGHLAGVDTLIKTLFSVVDTPAAMINGYPLSAYAGRYYNDYVGNFDLVEKFDRESGHNALFYKATAKRNFVKLQLNPENGQIVSKTSEGALSGFEFKDFDGTRFNTFVILNLGELGWQNLSRVP
jgi:CubicO group peptidase (beta-lactamase class C family)